MKITELPLARFLKKNGYLLLILVCGVVLMLLPGERRAEKERADEITTEAEMRLAATLARMEGVGEVHVLLAEKEGRGEGFAGALVVCSGADRAEVRLRVIRAVSVFTGLGSDKILVQQIKE